MTVHKATSAPDTADQLSTSQVAVADEIDGLEFENSSTQIDARFVPDDVSFQGRKARDAAFSVPLDYGKVRREC